MTTAAIEREVLCKLRDAGGNLVNEGVLWREVSAESAVPVRRAEFTAMLRQMQERKEILGDLTLDGQRWQIGGAGRTRLIEANL